MPPRSRRSKNPLSLPTLQRSNLRRRLRGVESLESRNLMAVVGDYVWWDENNDGMRSGGDEVGLNGVEVKLFTSAGVLVDTTVTGNSQASQQPGFYSFENVSPGDHYIEFIPPRALCLGFGERIPGTDSVVNSTGKSDVFTVIAGADNNAVDAGLRRTFSCIGNQVWWDQNEDGLQVDIEPGIAGTTVRLLQNGNTLDTQVTNAAGQYIFTDLTAGEYRVQFEYPSGFDVASMPKQLASGQTDSDLTDSDGFVNSSDGLIKTEPFELSENDYYRDIDQGFYRTVNTSKVGNYVWRDLNSDGLQNEGPSYGVNGVTVQLYDDSNDSLVTSTTTMNDANGNPGYYQFATVPEGSHYLKFVAPGETFTQQFASANPLIIGDSAVDADGVTLPFFAGFGDDLTLDAGLLPKIDLSLSSIVSDETPAVNSVVTYDLTISNGAGFSDASQVTVVDVLPEGLQYISDNSGGTYNPATRAWNVDTLTAGTSKTIRVYAKVVSAGTQTNRAQVQTASPSDIDSTPGNAATVHEDDDVNISIIPSASIGNYVWRDANNNGIQDEVDSFGINGVTVTLFTAGGSQVGQPAVTADKDGKPGYYLFSDINAGEYYVQFTVPTGQVFTSTGAGTTTDSDADNTGKTATFQLLSGIDQPNIDAGLRPIDLSLTSTFNELTPTLGSYVIYTVTVSNASGLSTAFSTTVSALLPAGVTYVSDDGNGFYNSTTGVWTVAMVAPGTNATLSVQGLVTNAGAKTAITEISTALVPDIDSTPGNAATINEDDNATVTIIPSASIGNYVWRDANNNGIQDEVDSFGINGVTVTLFTASGSQVGQPTVTADKDGKPGYYLFSDINPGQYYVQFTAPTGQVFTSTGAGTTTDSDADNTGKTASFQLLSGIDQPNIDAGLRPIDLSLTSEVSDSTPSVGAVVTYTITVSNSSQLSDASGVTVSDVLPVGVSYVSHDGNGFNSTTGVWTIGALASNASVTLSVRATVANAGAKTVTTQIATATEPDLDSTPGNAATINEDDSATVTIIPSASIGDYVWRDANNNGIQDEADSFGINGVTVTLFTAGGSQVGQPTVTADKDGKPGYYLFSDINPGEYYVQFTAPNGQVFTSTGAGTTTDSDADNTGKTATFQLLSGIDQPNIDAGLRPIDLSLTSEVSDSTPSLGAVVTYTISVSNSSQLSDASGVTVSDVLPVGVSYVSHDGNGFNSTTGVWTIGALASGASVTLSVRATVANAGAKTVTTQIATAIEPDLDSTPGNAATINEDDSATVTIIPSASIGDYVLRDANNNGIQDEADSFGINGVTVTLFTAGGSQVGQPTVTADKDGKPGYYLFSDINPGEYYVQFTAPTGQVFTSTGAGTTTDSDADNTGKTATFQLLSGIDQPNIDAGLRPVDLALILSVSDATPTLNSEVSFTVTITNESGFSGASGVSVVDILPAGFNYISNVASNNSVYDAALDVWNVFEVPAGSSRTLVVVAKPINGGTKTTLAQIKTADQPDIDSTPNNAPTKFEDDSASVTATPSATIGDYVWRDENNDGIQNEPTSAGVNGVSVALFSENGTQVSPAVLTANDSNGRPGYYSFTDVNPGNYYVVFTAGAGQSFTSRFVGSQTSDSNADTNGKTNTFTLSSGVDELSIDAGISSQTCAAMDWTGNTATSGTAGNVRTLTIGNVSAKASGFSRDRTTGAWSTAYLGAYGGGLGVTDSSEGNGSGDTHVVDNLGGRDNYIVFAFNQPIVLGSIDLDYVVGDSDLSIWIGTVPTAFNTQQALSDSLLAGLYFEENGTLLTTARRADINASEIVGNFIVIASSTTDLSVGDRFKLTKLNICTPGTQRPASLGNSVWHDLNGNGIRELSEPGIPGASVTLTGGGSDGVINGVGDTTVTTATSTTGEYGFADLVPGTQYQVRFALPTGYLAASPRRLGSDRTVDSDGLVSNFIILGSGQNDNSIDAGFYKEVKVGNYVWNDTDQDGIQDGTEVGITNVALTLSGTSGDGTIITRSTTTTSNGSYLFSGLPPGSYQVTVAASNFTSGAALSGFTASPSLVGTNRAIDSSASPAATSPTALASDATDSNVDFGYYLALTRACTNMYLEGNTATSGTFGNILTFTSGIVSAKASAFSRDSGGKWESAYLGRFGGGLGVTDRSEGNGSGNAHTVDNITRNNYIVFEFSRAVTVDSAFLGYVAGDSDIRVWIGNGNNTFSSNTSYTLSDNFLANLGFTEVNTGSSGTRTADINAGNVAGNVLVIAANTGETNDQFKVAELSLCANIPITNSSTKFFTIDDDNNRTFQYGSVGEFRQNFGVVPTSPRGITANVTGTNVWIADYSGRIFNYTSSGAHVANWSSQIGGIQGVTTDGSNIWTVSESTDRVYYYPGGTTYANGTNNAPRSSFPLNFYNNNPTGITTDGTFIWVVNEGNVNGGGGDMVFKYTKSGQCLGRWQLDVANSRPTGITIDPSGGNRIWVVDNASDRIYEYAGATGVVSGGLLAARSYALAADNPNAQDIADPPSPDAEVQATEASLAINEQFINPIINPNYNSFNATDVNSDGVTSPADALAIINRLSSLRRGETPANPDWIFDDVSNDGQLSPIDALLVINFLSSDRTPAPPLPPEVLPSEPDANGESFAATEQAFADFDEGDNIATDALTGEGEQGSDAFFSSFDWSTAANIVLDDDYNSESELVRLRRRIGFAL